MLFVVLYFDYETKQTTIQTNVQTHRHPYTCGDTFFGRKSWIHPWEQKQLHKCYDTHTQTNVNPTMSTNKTNKQTDK